MNRRRPSRVLLRLFDFLTEKRVFQRAIFDCKEKIILSKYFLGLLQRSAAFHSHVMLTYLCKVVLASPIVCEGRMAPPLTKSPGP